MLPSPKEPATRPGTEAPIPIGQWLFLFGLLAAEILAVTGRHWWSVIVGYGGTLTLLFLCLGSALIVCFFDRVRREKERLLALLEYQSHGIVLILAQIASYAGFLYMTVGLAKGEFGELAHAGKWYLVWGSLGGLAFFWWCLAVLPIRAWWYLLSHFWKELLVWIGVGFAAWYVSQFTSELWSILADSTLWGAEHLLKLVFSDIVVDRPEKVIGTSLFRVHIHSSCSGYEGLGIVGTFLGVYLWVCRDSLRFPQAYLLIPMGLLAVWLGNMVRITLLICIGAWGSPEVALGGFHTQAGGLAFNAVALGMVALSCYSSFFSREFPIRNLDRSTETNPSSAYLLPLLVIVATSMITGIFAVNGIDRFYPLRLLTVGIVFWIFRNTYMHLGWSWSMVAIGAGIAVSGLWLGLEWLRIQWSAAEGGELMLPNAAPHSPFLWIARLVGVTIAVPLAEELAFRGYLLRQLQGEPPGSISNGKWSFFAIAISSLLFGLLHGDKWIAGTAAGICYALIYLRSGRLADAVIAHAVTNATLAIPAIIQQDWGAW